MSALPAMPVKNVDNFELVHKDGIRHQGNHLPRRDKTRVASISHKVPLVVAVHRLREQEGASYGFQQLLLAFR